MGFKGKVAIADDGDDGNVPAAQLEMATSIFTRITNYYATETERDTETAVPSKMSAAEKLGTRCWVDSRKGFCFWDGTVWKWEPIHTVSVGYRPSSAQVAVVTPLNILQNSMVLPAGNRNVEVKARCNVAAVGSGGWNARAYVSGTNLGNGYVCDRALGFAGDVDSGFSSWDLVCSGTVAYTLYGLNANGSGICDFSDNWLTIIDHGPA